MAKKFFLNGSIAIAMGWTFFFFHRGDFSWPATVAFLVSGILLILVFGIFVMKNRGTFNEITEEPSNKNFQILKKLFKQKTN